MSDLASRLDKFANRHVLCIGDIMLDRYVYGRVDRISPEAPIPVLHTGHEAASLGGAGNVARNIATLGGKVDFIGMVGKDRTGDDIADALNALPHIAQHLIVDPSRPSTLKTRYIAENQQLLRADYEDARPVTQDIEQEIIDQIIPTIKNASVIILSDYAKGLLTATVIAEVIKLAKKSSATVIIDPKGRDFERYRGASYLTPNRKELSDVMGKAIKSAEEADAAAQTLMRELDIGAILVKLGADGVCLARKGKPPVHLRARAREVFDVSGAGDTVAATLALALAGGFGPAEAAELANIAGSIVVGKVGTAALTRDEIARELLHQNRTAGDGKVISTSNIAALAESWRRQGLKVGFTNGCFDLLHPGHISLLRQAKATCDRLIVGLNSDASVKRLKGSTRPIQNEAARSAVLASLADVDQVVIFWEDTPYELIKLIRPDMLVKGADYSLDKVVGADLVQEWGGKVVLAQLAEGHSTTGTIAKMQK